MFNPVSILLPVYNEVENIDKVITAWITQLSALPHGSKVEVEDANSNDGTRQVLEKLEEIYPSKLKVRYRNDRDGFRNSIARLISDADNGLLFVADSDGQYECSDILHFLNKLQGDSDLIFIKGIKIARNDGLIRKVYSKIINLYCSKIFRIEYLDLNSSHYLISKSLVKIIYPTNSNFGNQEKKGGRNKSVIRSKEINVNQFGNWTFSKLINIEIALRVVLSNFKYERVYVKHYKRISGPSRGHPSSKIIFDGVKTIRDINNLKKEFFY